MNLKYHIWSIGCQMNDADARHLSARLESRGYLPALRAKDAHILIINTCVVRQQAEDKIYLQLEHASARKRKHKKVIIALMGCLVGNNGVSEDLKRRFPFVDVFMPPSNPQPLLDFLQPSPAGTAGEEKEGDLSQAEEYNLPQLEKGSSIVAHVPIVLGCSHACSFCIIPYRRGPEKSRPKKDILEEVRRLAEQGIKEVILLGQIVDRYGLDFQDGTDLAGLLHETARVEGLKRLRFLTGHPNWFTDRLLETVAVEQKVCPHFEIPFQSGNDEVLSRMRRGYTADDYRRLIERIRRRIPEAGIHTDIIVGFPGETEDQFMDSYRLLKEINPVMARIAKYSPRPQTLAARQMEDDVPEAEKERRRVLLEDLLAELLTERHKALLHTQVEVLVEAKGKKNRWGGRTPQSALVFFDSEQDLRGELVRVTLDWTGPFSLIGHLPDAAAAEV
ncbi:MAG: tRNA (N6-isopentenyl adenosine(37)-C2)-methylthiotransferase MiaB [Lentisphaerota bacterium]